MAFPSRLLTTDETIVLDLHPHWRALVMPVGFTAVLGAATASIYIALLRNQTQRWILVGIATVLWLVLALPRIARWKFTEFVLTNERLIHRSGVLAKISKEIPLERVNDVTVTQGVLDRILGSGTITLESAGEHGQTDFAEVPHPIAVQKQIYETAEARKGSGIVSKSGSAAGSVADELSKLAALRDRGILTEDEFQARKLHLLQ